MSSRVQPGARATGGRRGVALAFVYVVVPLLLLSLGELAARRCSPAADAIRPAIASPISIFSEVVVDGERRYRVTHPLRMATEQEL